MGGRARDQRACVRSAARRRTARARAPGVLAAGRPGAAFRARAELNPGGGAFMDPEARRADVESEPCSARVESTTRSTRNGASAGVDARR